MEVLRLYRGEPALGEADVGEPQRALVRGTQIWCAAAEEIDRRVVAERLAEDGAACRREHAGDLGEGSADLEVVDDRLAADEIERAGLEGQLLCVADDEPRPGDDSQPLRLRLRKPDRRRRDVDPGHVGAALGEVEGVAPRPAPVLQHPADTARVQRVLVGLDAPLPDRVVLVDGPAGALGEGPVVKLLLALCPALAHSASAGAFARVARLR